MMMWEFAKFMGFSLGLLLMWTVSFCTQYSLQRDSNVETSLQPDLNR